MKEQMDADENVYYWLNDEIEEWNFKAITDETSCIFGKTLTLWDFPKLYYTGNWGKVKSWPGFSRRIFFCPMLPFPLWGYTT